MAASIECPQAPWLRSGSPGACSQATPGLVHLYVLYLGTHPQILPVQHFLLHHQAVQHGNHIAVCCGLLCS